MAITQASSDKRKVGQLGDRVNDLVVTSMGGVTFMSGSGAPVDGSSGSGKAMEKGSVYINRADGLMWIKTSAAAASVTWVKVGTQS